MDIKRLGSILAIVAFVVVVTIGSIPVQGIQETTATDCSAQGVSCGAYGLADFHAIGSLETALAYQLFKIQFEDYENEIKTLAILLLAVFIGAGVFVQKKAGSAAYQYWRATRHWHIKFWDHIHQALTQGIIHSKTLDCA